MPSPFKPLNEDSRGKYNINLGWEASLADSVEASLAGLNAASKRCMTDLCFIQIFDIIFSIELINVNLNFEQKLHEQKLYLPAFYIPACMDIYDVRFTEEQS